MRFHPAWPRESRSVMPDLPMRVVKAMTKAHPEIECYVCHDKDPNCSRCRGSGKLKECSRCHELKSKYDFGHRQGRLYAFCRACGYRARRAREKERRDSADPDPPCKVCFDLPWRRPADGCPACGGTYAEEQINAVVRLRSSWDCLD